MWTCPYCDVAMRRTSSSNHLKNKQGCSQQHALHLAEEAKKKEKQKQMNMAFFRPISAAKNRRG